MSITSATSTRSRWSTLFMVLLLALLFDRLFWDRSVGLNLTLFPLAAMALAVWRHGWNGISVPARVAYIGTVVSATMVSNCMRTFSLTDSLV